jgi:hypothetical protein
LLAALIVEASPPHRESLEFTGYYRGVFSSWLKLAVARVRLFTDVVEAMPGGQPLRLSTLEISTAPYRKVELIYPFRFYHTSLFSPVLPRTELVYVSQRARRADEVMLWFDWRARRVERFKWREVGARDGLRRPAPDLLVTTAGVLIDALRRRYPAASIDLKRLRFAGFGEPELRERGADRLALLHHVRFRALSPGRTITIPVSDGKALSGYRVTAEEHESLKHGETELATLRLRFDPVYVEPDRKAHPSVHVWIGTDSRRLPVRFEAENALGTFQLILRASTDLPFAPQ